MNFRTPVAVVQGNPCENSAELALSVLGFKSYNTAMESTFAEHLKRFGPGCEDRSFTVESARAYCRDLAQSHYENFSVATWLLPRKLVPHFYNIYAYCRWADDLGDETGGGEHALELLRWWREELDRCYAGEARHPVMVALRTTIEAFRIPKAPFVNLIRAFEQDQVVKRYSTFAQVCEYCVYSANPVGHLVLYLCECFSEENALLADKICTGLQLANFWQDVARDLEIGRVYLPAEDRERFGYADVDLEARRFTPAFRALMEFEVDRARGLFLEGLPLVDRVPMKVRLDIELFAQGGLAILRKIEGIDYNVWHTRPTLSKREKIQLLAKTVWRTAWGMMRLWP